MNERQSIWVLNSTLADGTIKYRMVHIQFDGIYSFGLDRFMNSYNLEALEGLTKQVKREPIKIHSLLTSIMTLKWL